MENLVRTLIYDGQVSLTVANTTEIVQTAIERHHLSETSAYVLGKALSALTFMSACLKDDRGEISLALKGDGSYAEIGISGNKLLNIRGFIGNTALEGGQTRGQRLPLWVKIPPLPLFVTMGTTVRLSARAHCRRTVG